MKKYYFIIAVFFILLGIKVYGQISTEELPVSFSFDNTITLKLDVQTVKSLPSFDMAKIHQEDADDEQNGVPPRFGYKHKVDYNLNNSGTWTILPNGDRIWQLEIYSQRALSINLLYDKFWLPDGAKFFIYSNDKKYYIGAFTSANNKGDKKNVQGFATGLIYSDRITLEYYLPADTKDEGIISIAYVVRGYKYIKLPESIKDSYEESGNCQINVNCSEGQNWQNEKNAVALILVNGNRYCTGSLVNTTANDFRSLFLTADHCLGGWANDVKHDAITDPLLNHWSFYWHYESSGCANSVPSIKSTVGATVVANNSISDFALLRLSEDPKNKIGVTPYYLGWDRSGNAGNGGVGIHHPSGDIKKIATHNITPYTSNCFSSTNYSNSNFWKLNWMQTTNGHSVTEGGSSGSPLINNNHRVIGQLFGAGNTNICPNTNCSNPSADIANYGKFSISWTGNNATDNRRKLQPWLDPVGTNPNTLNGIAYNPPPTISGASQICVGSSATYTVSNAPSGFTWSCSSNLTKTSQSGNTATFKANSDGNGWVGIRVGNVDIVKYNVLTGEPATPYVYSTERTHYNGTYTFTAAHTGTNTPNSCVWRITSSSNSLYYSVQFTSSFPQGSYAFPDATSTPVTCYVTVALNTSCGLSKESLPQQFTIQTGHLEMPVLYSAAYPNPAGNELIIDKEETNNNEINTNAIDNKQNTQANNATVKVLLYSHSTTKLVYSKDFPASAHQIKIDTSTLPNGIYYLNIISNGEKIKQQTIVVKH